MTSIAQRAELQAKIWKIANDVRGAVDGWDFNSLYWVLSFIALLVRISPIILKVAMLV